MSRLSAFLAMLLTWALIGFPAILLGSILWNVEVVRSTIAPERFRAEQQGILQSKIKAAENQRETLAQALEICRLELARVSISFDLEVALAVKSGLSPADAYRLHKEALHWKETSCADLESSISAGDASLVELRAKMKRVEQAGL